CMQTLGFPWTF
nr:immunoglobulin light chain junction region [Macaca mulatta]